MKKIFIILALVLEGGMSSFAAIALQYIPEEQRETVKPYLVFPIPPTQISPPSPVSPSSSSTVPKTKSFPMHKENKYFRPPRNPKHFSPSGANI